MELTRDAEKTIKCVGIGVLLSAVTLINIPIGLGCGLYYTIKLWKAKYRRKKLRRKVSNKSQTFNPEIGFDQHELYGLYHLIENYKFSRKKSLFFAIPLTGPFICGRVK